MKLTHPQFKLLERIVKTNGGGVSVYSLNGTEQRIMRRLEEMDLVQGKRNEQYMIVHTREGLVHYRAQKL